MKKRICGECNTTEEYFYQFQTYGTFVECSNCHTYLSRIGIDAIFDTKQSVIDFDDRFDQGMFECTDIKYFREHNKDEWYLPLTEDQEKNYFSNLVIPRSERTEG